MKSICQAQLGVHIAQAGKLKFPDTIHTEVHETQHMCCDRHGALMKCDTRSAEEFFCIGRRAERARLSPLKGRHPFGQAKRDTGN